MVTSTSPPKYHTRYERVAEGTKFSFVRTGPNQLVEGRGPLLGAILVGVTGEQGKEGEWEMLGEGISCLDS